MKLDCRLQLFSLLQVVTFYSCLFVFFVIFVCVPVVIVPVLCWFSLFTKVIFHFFLYVYHQLPSPKWLQVAGLFYSATLSDDVTALVKAIGREEYAFVDAAWRPFDHV